ncbi:hypothetical protein GDO78_015076 [Eleutherodactylus coqui]|uniref:KRAB domain-containing protein n=1 Tax=Eleutherodactylus coqui TaxID=57060 RepID=A0A8J6B2K2_ELECQ|nr:hypothetical protein GDO78_015076 [Eleutherodactylus coqui]
MTDPMGFDKDTSTMTKSILDLTLEIIFLLTGEDYIVVKKASGEHLATNSCPPVSWEGSLSHAPLPSRISEWSKDQKILDLTNKIIELLTGEAPIRCQDVTVHFSMEEWEYLEGHKGPYKDFFKEDYQPFTSVGKKKIFCIIIY